MYDPDIDHLNDWQWQPKVYDAILVLQGETEEFDGKLKRESISNPDYAPVVQTLGVSPADQFGIYWKTGVDDAAPAANARLTVDAPDGEELWIVGSVQALPFSRWAVRATLGVSDG